MTREDKFMMGVFAMILTCVVAWGTHVVVCIQTSQWLLLIAGAILFPIGIIHGFGWWIGAWN